MKLKTNVLASEIYENQFELSQKSHETFKMSQYLKKIKQTINGKHMSLISLRERLLQNVLNDDFKKYSFYKNAKMHVGGESLHAVTTRLFDVMVDKALACRCIERFKDCKLRSKRVRLNTKTAEAYRNYYVISISFSELFTFCQASKLRVARSVRHNLCINFNKIRQQIDIRKQKKQRYKEMVMYSNQSLLKGCLDRWKRRVSKCLYSRKNVSQGLFYHQFKRKHFAFVTLKCETI